MIHGALKASRTHVHHLSTLRPGPWSSRAERSPLKQREELYRCCSLIYKDAHFMDAGRIRPLFLPPHPRRNRYTPLRQTKPAPFRFPGFRKSRESCTSAVSVFLSNSDPLRWALSWGTIENVSDEADSISLPRFPKEPRKLHIHRLRLPFRSEAQGFGSVENDSSWLPLKPGPASLGSELGNDRDGLPRQRCGAGSQ